MDRLIPLATVAQRLTVPESAVRRWVRLGRLPAPVVLPDGRRRWRAAELTAWMQRLPTDEPPPREPPARERVRQPLPEPVLVPVCEPEPAIVSDGEDEEEEEESDPADGLAADIIRVLGAVPGRWMSGQEICAAIGDHADCTSGTWYRVTRKLRNDGLIESSRKFGYRMTRGP